MDIKSKKRNASTPHARRHNAHRKIHSNKKVNWLTPDFLFVELDRLLEITLKDKPRLQC